MKAPVISLDQPIEVILETLRPLVRGFLIRRLSLSRNRIEDADDLTQNVLMNVYRFRSQFKEKAKFTTWVYRIAANKVKDYNKYITSGCRNYCLEGFSLDDIENWEGPRFSSSESLEDDVICSVEGEKLRRKLLKEISSCDAVILALRKKGHGFREIAEELDMPLSTVKTSYYRSLTKAERIMGELDESSLPRAA